MIPTVKHYLKKTIQKKQREVSIGSFKLTTPREHKIDEYLHWLKYYSRNFPRIAKYLEGKYQTFSIIDIGANIGDSVALLRAANVEQHVYAVEGESTYFELLKSNLKQFSNCEAFKCFLGETTKTEFLCMEKNEGTAKLSNNTSASVNVVAFDEFISNNGLKNIKLIKIDTDGFDLKILRGGLKSIAQFKPVLFFEYDASFLEEQGDEGLAIFDTLEDIGYNQILYYDNYGKFLISISTHDKKMIKQLYSYIRKGEGAFHYYDVCVFHGDDDLLAESIIENELQFFS